MLILALASLALTTAPLDQQAARSGPRQTTSAPADHVDPPCAPAGCPIPIPYPPTTGARAPEAPTTTGPSSDRIGDEPGVLTGHGPIRTTPVPGVKFRTAAPGGDPAPAETSPTPASPHR